MTNIPINFIVQQTAKGCNKQFVNSCEIREKISLEICCFCIERRKETGKS